MNMKAEKTLFIASPHGVCGGVKQAIETVEQVLREDSSPVWVLHELVHNDRMTAELVRRGVRFTEDLAEVPNGSRLIFGAHGVSSGIEKMAAEKHLQTVDATCPLVRKLHSAAETAVKNGEKIIFFGHKTHPEAIGVIGRVPPESIFIVESVCAIASLPDLGGFPCRMFSQTTMKTDEIDKVFAAAKMRFPQIQLGTGACYATVLRQNAVRKLAEKVKFILILGAHHSSNTKRLEEIAVGCGAEAVLIDCADAMPAEKIRQLDAVGISSGASAPESLFCECVRKLEEIGFTSQFTVSGE